MKEIASYRDSVSAHFAKTRLENAGIRAFVTDELAAVDAMFGLEPGYLVKLRVAPEDTEGAIAVLFGAASPLEIVCPRCNSDDVGSGAPVFLALVVCAFTLGLLKPKRRCNACLHTWRE